MGNVIGLVIMLAALVGWVMNIVHLINDNTMAMGMVVARVVGIFVAPLGAVLGYF